MTNRKKTKTKQITPPQGKANRRSFRAWLSAQAGRDDAVGDLAGDALRKSSGAWTSHPDLLKRMQAVGASAEALRALDDARKEFAATQPRLAAKKPPQVVVVASDPGEWLAACPFCAYSVHASAAEVSTGEIDLGSGDYDGFWGSVQCICCGALGPTEHADTEEDARAYGIQAWNSRGGSL